MLKNKKIGKYVIPKFLLGITASVLTILILRPGFVDATSSAAAVGVGSRPLSQPAQGCDSEPTGVETSDYWLNFNLLPGDMPDPQFDEQPARLEVHRVRPVYAHGKCQWVPNRAIVLIHGRVFPGPPNFDLRHPTAEDPEGGKLSLQESLAKAGIDTFAPSLLGYGRSTRFENGLDDPCNASLPAYNVDGSCSFAEGCDRSSNPGIMPLNQQTRYFPDGIIPAIDGLGVNPLAGHRCPHSSGYRFARMDVWAHDVIRVIDDAIARAHPDNNKVVLLGHSLGGVRVARALYLLGPHAHNKVRRVVFLSAIFNRVPAGPLNLPTEENDLPPAALSTSFPLSLAARTTENTFSISPAREPVCTGRLSSGVPDDFWQQNMDLDVLGRQWGGNDPTNPAGVVRHPTFSNYGSNPAVAATFTIPTLVLHGLDDITAPTQNSDDLFNALTSVTNKALKK